MGQCFVGIDVSKAVGYNDDDNARRAVQTHVPRKYRMRLGEAVIDMKEADIRLHRDTVLLTGNGLKLFLMRCCRPKAFDVAKHFGTKIEHFLAASKEQDALSQIMQVFRGEEMIHQFGVGKYRTDLYFPRYKLAIEYDEFDHLDRDIGYKLERQKHIEKLLNCTFVRFNPDAKDFYILDVVNKIFVQIKSPFQM